jgi:tetratricopeptide (TPR) repeat protein
VSQIALARHDEVAFRRGMAAVSTAIPENPHGRLLAGDLAYHDHRAGDALQDYQAAYTMRPSFAEAYFRVGVVLRRRGDIAAAKAVFTRALDAHPVARAIPRYSNNLAFCLAKLGSLDAALEYYGQNTQYPLSALEASRLLLQRGELTQARDFVQRAVDWLSDPQVAALPQNQGPWEFETSTDGIQLTEPRDKLCYAHIQLAMTMFLLGNEPGANDVIQRVSCAGVVADVRDIVTWDLERIRHANADLAEQIEIFQRRILERLP